MAEEQKPLADSLRELTPARLGEINLLLRAIRTPRSPEVTVRLISEMAGVCDRIPQPGLYIRIALALGVINVENDKFTLSAVGQRLVNASGEFSDRLNSEQLSVLAPEVLGHPSLVEHVRSVLDSMTRERDGSRMHRPGAIQFSEIEYTALQLLQVFQFCAVRIDSISISSQNAEHLFALIGEVSGLGEEELWRLLQLTNRRARAAEEFVVEYERRRLSELGRDDLAALVERVSEHNSAAGFDIRSFDAMGAMRYIEVKSSTGSAVRFFWSSRERRVAQKYGNSYWIYFVPRVHELLTPELFLIRDPVMAVGVYLLERPSEFEVVFAGDQRLLPSVIHGGVASRTLVAAVSDAE